MKKLMVLSAVHGVDGGRYDVYKFFLRRMEHIRKKFGVETLVVGSEGDLSKELTEEYGVKYLEYDNNPVSNKFSAGMKALRGYGPDYVMILGSDDIISDSLIEKYLWDIEDKPWDVIGITDSYYLALHPKRAWFNHAVYWPGYAKKTIIGYARCWSARLLDAVDWAPWPDGLNSGLDFAASMHIASTGLSQATLEYSIKEMNWLHVDIKTIGNISSLSPIIRRGATPVDLDDLFAQHLPEDEARLILEYRTQAVENYKQRR
jgi:hypothetical protein